MHIALRKQPLQSDQFLVMDESASALSILQVSTADVLGGAESSAWNLFQAYRRRGNLSWLAVGRKNTDDPDVFSISNQRQPTLWERAIRSISHHLESLEDLRGIWRLRSSLHMLVNPREEIDRQLGIENFGFPATYQLLDLPPDSPDILHCHNLHGEYFDLRALSYLSHKVPVVLSLRDTWLLTGHCAHFLDCDRWRHGCGKCPYLQTYPSIKRDATAYNWRRKQDVYRGSRLYLTTPSQWLMDKVHASMLHGAQYRVIPNGIDLANFRPGSRVHARQALGLPDRARIVLMIAHNEFKDFQTMKEAVARIETDESTELVFICLGRGGVEKTLGQGRMLFREFERDQQCMALYYRASDVYVHAAKAEVFGKTVTEAMACGIPVVATSVGGIPEQIDDGHTGFLVTPGDSRAMAAVVQRLLTDASLCSAVGFAGSEAARERFGLKHQVDAFLGWYSEVREDWQQSHSSGDFSGNAFIA